jgi:carbamoyltransferase
MKKIIASFYPSPFDIQLRHEINCSLFKNGEIYSYEESKLSSIKNDPIGMFPERSFFSGLKELKIEPHKIKTWIFPKPAKKNSINNYFYFFKHFCKSYRGSQINFKKWFLKKVKFIKHHDMHVYNAIGGSGFKKCFYISSDGGGDLGDKRNTTWGIYENFKIKEYGKIFGTNSLSSFHAFVTEMCGLRNENGKLSGLSSYGSVQNELYKKLSKLLIVKKNGIFFDRKRYSQTLPNPQCLQLDSYDRNKIINFYQSKTNILKICSGYLIQDIAATAEKILSDKMIEFLKKIQKYLPKKINDAVYSGGIFLNVKLNEQISLEKLFKKNYFSMSPSDAGLSLGGIFSQKVKIKKNIFLNTALLPILVPPLKMMK